jgi:PAS domain S-box-containing protein
MADVRSKGVRDALATLQLDQARWQAVLDTARDAIISIDPAGLVTLFNRCAEEMFGYPASEVLGHNVNVLMASPYREEHDEYLRNYHRTRVAKAIGLIRYVEGRRKDGEIFPIELSVSEAHVGEEVLYTAIVRDVTERKYNEEALRRERDFATRLVETAEAIVLVRDPDGRIVLYNPFMEKLSGYPLAEMQGRDWYAALVPEAECPRLREVFSQALRDGEAKGYVGSIVTREGAVRDVEWHSRVLQDSNGSVSGVLSIGQDITDRLRAERHVAAQYSVTRVLADAQSIAGASAKLLQAICEEVGWSLGELWYADPEARVLRFDGLWCDPSFRAGEYEAATRKMVFAQGEGIPGTVWQSGKSIWISNLGSLDSGPRLEMVTKLGIRAALGFPILLGDDAVGVLVLFDRSVRGPDEDQLRVLEAVGRQIGGFIERKRAAQGLCGGECLTQERERLADIGAITAKIAHDLGNPLTGVSMQAQLILQYVRQNDSALAAVGKPAERLSAEVRRLEDLVREFLTFAREQRLDLQTLDLRRFLRDVIDLWEAVGAERRISVALEFRDSVDRIEGDHAKLRRVLDNLLKNAIEAIGEGPGEVMIAVSQIGPEKVRISVEDSGGGIPQGVQPFRLFETTKEGGSGLGLAVSKQIVLAHGGDLVFAAREPRGTVFHIDLPMRCRSA